MRILICPDKFKGSLSAGEAAEAIARGVRRAIPDAELLLLPLADGGEGTMDLLGRAYGLRSHRLEITGPLRKPITATYYLGGRRAVVESAAGCGLHLVPAPRRDPENTTTIGVGMLLDDALARGATDIQLLLGGSATNDCGAGMAAALGYRFYTADGHDIVPMAGSLGHVARIDAAGRHPRLERAQITALCDVDNPLLGPSGATLTYAPQKGAARDRLPALERAMARFADVLERDVRSSVRDIPGAGAAGGLGAGALAFLGGELRSGVETVLDAVGFPRAAATADLIVTGEGAIDEQTLHGKVIAGVVRAGRPTVAVCGRSSVSAATLGVEAILSLTAFTDLSAEQTMTRAAELVEEAVYRHFANPNT